MDFKKAEISDKVWVDEILSRAERVSLEYNFTTIFIWKDVYNNQIAKKDGILFCSSGLSKQSFLFPVGEEYKKGLSLLDEYSGGDLSFFSLTDRQCSILEELYPGRFSFSEDRNSGDYIYRTSTLTELKGKKLSSKRNHINRFLAENDNWSYEKITKENMSAVKALDEKWFEENEKSPGLIEEKRAVEYALKYFDELGLTGGLLRVGNEAVAYSVGDKLNESTFLVHIEKALLKYRGSYAMINNQFAKNECAGYEFIDREEDTGDDGLRKAKLSYRPEVIARKFIALTK